MAMQPTGKSRIAVLRWQARRSLSLPTRDIALGLEALLFLAAARLLLLMLPFARAMRLLGLRAGIVGPGHAAPAAQNGDDEALREIGVAIRRASRVAPFHAVCLPQAVTASLMLRRRHRSPEIHFGVIREADGAMSAHAWTCCSGQAVTGMEGMVRHIPIATFTAGAV